MIAIPLLAALLLGAPQETVDTPKPDTSPVKSTATNGKAMPPMKIPPKEFIKMQAKAAEDREQAVVINDLAGKIHSEQDARKVVDQVAEILTNHRHLMWAARSYRHRVAHAEFEAVSSSSGLIPEQRIVDVWNEYIREVDGPEETLVTAAELHNLRDALYTSASRYIWPREISRSIWTMPNIYAVDSSGRVAEGCRALEALKLIHDMHDTFMNVRIARARVAQGGWLVSENLIQRGEGNSMQMPAHRFSVAELQTAGKNNAVVQNAAQRYVQSHGEDAYDQMIRRLFDELFPPE